MKRSKKRTGALSIGGEGGTKRVLFFSSEPEVNFTQTRKQVRTDNFPNKGPKLKLLGNLTYLEI